jgi:hypothetical protein
LAAAVFFAATLVAGAAFLPTTAYTTRQNAKTKKQRERTFLAFAAAGLVAAALGLPASFAGAVFALPAVVLDAGLAFCEQHV